MVAGTYIRTPETREKNRVASLGHTASVETRAKIGDARRTHGHSPRGQHTPTYLTWDGMRQRCNNPKAHGYKYYGGRGIKVCAHWDSFENFLADAGERPEGMTLDRIDNDGDYAPGNCRWATAEEQRANRCTCRTCPIHGRAA